jgi:hypothetical protein
MDNLIFRISVQICRFGLAALFLFAVAAKLYFINDSTHSFLKNMPFLVGQRFAVSVAVGIIAAEAVAVLLLLIPRTVKIGAVWAGGLLMVFAGYALYYRFVLKNFEGLECGCFGGIMASQLGLTTALRNLVLLIPALVVIFGYSRLKLR